jgi:hypothetical protein
MRVPEQVSSSESRFINSVWLPIRAFLVLSSPPPELLNH